ncbi:hypothetical protein [Kribbia dieselivorans]|uniref:hypothetical protein n=1 Tax=Kribbia dieselivorans TaxID=331526 RepID=UPI00083877FD|nr:hypothetical protein [Kribbia dieselivorans]
MDNEIQLISDGTGLAVIGKSTDVERFLASEGLSSQDLGLHRLQTVFKTGAVGAQAASEIAANSGRWIKLTEQSAQAVKKYGLMDGKQAGVKHAMIGQPGDIKQWLQVAQGPGTVLANPALLAGAAGIMAQVAMEQAMDEIRDYLATIDEKVDDVLRAQKDAVLAEMVGVGLVIDEAMTVRAHVGRVSDVTWSKVQNSSHTIATTQAYALRQLDALAEKLEKKSRIGELAETAAKAESAVNDWVAVLARCFQLQDGIAVLELDRVLDATPEDLDQHRLGLKVARQERLDLIAGSTERLMQRMNAAAHRANAKVLLNPTTAPGVVRSTEHVALTMDQFHALLGIEAGRDSLEARKWVDAAVEVRDKAKDKALETGADGVDAVKRLGSETRERAGAVKGKLFTTIAERAPRRHSQKDEPA